MTKGVAPPHPTHQPPTFGAIPKPVVLDADDADSATIAEVQSVGVTQLPEATTVLEPMEVQTLLTAYHAFSGPNEFEPSGSLRVHVAVLCNEIV